jgi:uracil-DNA glycosylase family 4
MEPKAPFAECHKCPLRDKGKFVPSLKPTKTDGEVIAFIGESPGRTEVRKGEPFIGESGRLLKRVLRHHSIDVDNSLLTNAASCFLPDQEDKSDLKEAIECCRPRLIHELEQHGVKRAVTLGNAAVSSLLQTSTGITRLRSGPAREATFGTGITVIPTFHPAAALRSQALVPHIVGDIAKLSPKRPAFIAPDIRIIEDVKQAIKLLDELLAIKSPWPIVCDTESGKEKDEDIERTTNILCVGLGSMNPDAGNAVIVIGKPAILNHWVQEKLCRLLAKRGLTNQNSKYDCHILEHINHAKVKIAQVQDPMLMSYSLNENPGTHGLEYMAVEYLGAPSWKQEVKKFLVKPKDPKEIRQPMIKFIQSRLSEGPRLRAELVAEANNFMGTDLGLSWKKEKVASCIARVAIELEIEEFKGRPGEYRAHQIRWKLPEHEVFLATPDADGSYASIPPEKLHIYNAYDVQATRQLVRYFDKRIANKPELVRLNDFLMKASNALFPVERRGLRVDMKVNATLEEELTRELEEIGDFPFNPNSSQKTLEYFNKELGIDTDTTDKDFLLSITGDDDNPPTRKEEPHVVDLCRRLQEFRKAYRFKSTNVTAIRVKALASGINTIYPSFFLHTTTTGRLSSRNPNAQNIPRDSKIKNQFIPSVDGNVFVKVDYSQLELRVLCWLAKDEYMRSLFADETRDVFRELCVAVWGDKFLNANRGAQKEMRTLLKTMAYGIAYGRGAKAIAKAFNIPLQEAQRHFGEFCAMIPDIMNYQESVVREVMSGKDLITPFGRHRRFHLITDQNKVDIANQAKAFKPQSIGSDCNVLALTRLPDYIMVRNIIHDETLFECRPNEAEELAKTVSDTMIAAAEEVTEGYVPFRTGIASGKSWGTCEEWAA